MQPSLFYLTEFDQGTGPFLKIPPIVKKVILYP
jgi:hypothetical protein